VHTGGESGCRETKEKRGDRSRRRRSLEKSKVKNSAQGLPKKPIYGNGGSEKDGRKIGK